MSGEPKVRGRVVAVDGARLWVRREVGTSEVALPAGAEVRVGDLVEIEADGGALRVLTRPLRPEGRWQRHVLEPRRLRALEIRARVESEIRRFFAGRGFREVRTPLLVPNPGMETHIRPFRVTNAGGAGEAAPTYLPTSPEFAMKTLLVGGLEKIFQLAPAFRDEPHSVTHSPEFTLLEWYRAWARDEDVMRDTEELFAHVATAVHGRPVLTFGGRTISVEPPWPRLRVRDLFARHTGVDLTREAVDDDRFFQLWLDEIEPRLPADRAVFVTRYPESQAALAVVDADPDGTRWARRFEVFAGGVELANAFEELTDPVEQRRRFSRDMALRAESYGPEFPPNPLPEAFLGALEEGMPPSAGIALGVDRLVMLVADEPDLAQTLWLPATRP